jgi:hypothetical protein
MVKELAFRFKLYLLGVRFYESHYNPSWQEVYRQTLKVGHRLTISLIFQKVPCSDFVLRRSSLNTENYSSYVVTAHFSAEVPQALQTLEDRPFFFNGRYNDFGVEERWTLELISDIYLDFLKSVLDGISPVPA